MQRVTQNEVLLIVILLLCIKKPQFEVCSDTASVKV